MNEVQHHDKHHGENRPQYNVIKIQFPLSNMVWKEKNTAPANAL